MATHVNVDNFTRAETDRMFSDLQRDAGGINQVAHKRVPAPVDQQTVVRMNRDTLYSFAVVDISEGATIELPESGARYMSAMAVNNDHFVNQIFHDPGVHELTMDRLETPYVMMAVRTLADPTDPDDLASVASLQDQIQIEAGSSQPFSMPDYDTASFDETRQALMLLARGMGDFSGMFGSRDEVQPVRHLIGTAVGWGGLPTSEAVYVSVDPRLPVGSYEIKVGEVPVDGFWSISVYNAQGFFEPNESGVYSVNSVTGVPNDDGTITVRFGDHEPGLANAIPITEGWNYLIRLYRPHPEILDGSWQFPAIRA
jgi:hypothetical protein